MSRSRLWPGKRFGDPRGEGLYGTEVGEIEDLGDELCAGNLGADAGDGVVGLGFGARREDDFRAAAGEF